jgi:membrane protease YdiL (CAAX protease family)
MPTSATPQQGDIVARDPPKPNYWAGAVATLFYALAVFVFSYVVIVVVAFLWFRDRVSDTANAINDGPLLALVTLIGTPVQIALLFAIAHWRAGGGAAAYLGLTRFSLRDFLIGFVAIVALMTAIDGTSYLLGIEVVPTFEIDTWTTARASGWLVPLLAAVVVVGPVGEEVMFRGFLFRGWVTPDRRGVIAVLLITLIWSGMHIQYDLFGIAQVFLSGVVLGWIRWRSGSTALTSLLHMLVNLVATVETILKTGWSAT